MTTTFEPYGPCQCGRPVAGELLGERYCHECGRQAERASNLRGVRRPCAECGVHFSLRGRERDRCDACAPSSGKRIDVSTWMFPNQRPGPLRTFS